MRAIKGQILFLLILSDVGLQYASPNNKTSDHTVVFRNVSVVPMDVECVLLNQAVVVKNGRIAAVADVRKVPIPDDALVIDGSGKYLLPDLTDMHVHLSLSDCPLFLANGITTIREMNGDADHLKRQAQFRSGELPGALHDELRSIRDAGLSNFEVLQTTTTNPAIFVGLSAQSGTLEVGNRADLGKL